MTHPSAAIQSLYPTAIPLIDYVLLDDLGTITIPLWNEENLGPKPTVESLIDHTVTSPPPQPRWAEFGLVVMELPDVKTIFAQAIAAGEAPLAVGLGVALGKAADGQSALFLGIWAVAIAHGLVSPELNGQVQALAGAFDLPAEFIAGLGGGAQTDLAH